MIKTVWRLGLFATAGLTLAACGTTGNSITRLDYPTRAGGGSTTTLPNDGPAAPQKVGRPYQVNGRWYTPQADPGYDEVGIASWYGPNFQGKPTASGETFDMNQITAAHTTLPLPSIVEVTNLETGRSIQVRVNDRGPFVDGRIIDLSKAAAEALGTRQAGVAKVRVRYVGPAPADPFGPTRLAAAPPTQREFARAPEPPRSSATAAPPPPVTVALNALTPAVPAPPPVYVPPTPVYTPPVYAPPAPVYTPPPQIYAPAAPQPVQLASYSVADDPYASFQPVAAPLGPWTVRAGAYPELDVAQQAVEQLRATSPAEIRLSRIDGQVVYEVVIKSLPDQVAAGAVQRQIMAGGFPGAQVLLP